MKRFILPIMVILSFLPLLSWAQLSDEQIEKNEYIKIRKRILEERNPHSEKRIKEKGKDVYVKVFPIERSIGESIEFSGETHGSVGITFDIEYDSRAFTKNEEKGYSNNYKEGIIPPPGGDRGRKTFRLYPKKRGKFVVYTIKGFRGEETKRTKYIINIL